MGSESGFYTGIKTAKKESVVELKRQSWDMPWKYHLVDRIADFIAKYEGLSLVSYQDVGQWAICYGNRSYKMERKTKEECDKILRDRVMVIMDYVRRTYELDLTDNQIVALTSLHYNCKNPLDVIWRANNGYSDKSVANAIRMYVMAGGEALEGLRKRRGAEADLFLTN